MIPELTNALSNIRGMGGTSVPESISKIMNHDVDGVLILPDNCQNPDLELNKYLQFIHEGFLAIEADENQVLFNTKNISIVRVDTLASLITSCNPFENNSTEDFFFI